MDTLKQKMQFIRVCLMLLLLPLNMWGQSIDESVARERAQAFLQERNAGKPKAIKTAVKGRRAKGGQATKACDYYIFNTEADGGFVIVSGDDRTIPILGYADSGSIQEGSMPEGMKVLLMEASFLLRTSQLSITQIADRLHFADTPSFSKFFSRLKGQSPRAYRESL